MLAKLGLFLLFSSALLCCGTVHANLRGLHPELKPYYDLSKESFTCLNGLSSFPISYVNDDYCDCVDGSDEPGTSACSKNGGKFYCRNLGHQPLVLNSSFVDDGVCDCCDGSDEPAVKCKDTCLEEGAAAREALRSRAASFKAGLHIHRQQVEQAATLKQGWRLELESTEKLLIEQQQQLDAAKAALDAAVAKEEAAKKAEEAHRQADEALKAEQGDVAPPANEGGAIPSEAGELDGEIEETSVSGEGIDETEAAEELGDSDQSDEAAEEVEETAEERGRRIAAQWTSDPNAASGAAEKAVELEEEKEEEPASIDPEAGTKLPAETTSAPDSIKASGIWGKALDLASSTWKLLRAPADPRPEPGEVAKLSDEVGSLRSEHSELQVKVSDLERQRDALSKKLETDFGPDGAFALLADKCFETKVEKYTYEICPFDRAEQKEGRHSGTNLGRWHGFADSYTTMSFTDGDHCWQGPRRSLQVSMVCGSSDALSKVEEPSRCTYTAQFVTHAVCTEEEVAAVQKQLADAEQEISKKHDEL